MDIFVVSDHPETSQRVRDVLLREGENCPPEQVLSLDHADRVPRTPLGLVVLALSPDPERALDVLDRLQQQGPLRVLLVGPAGDSRLLLRAMRSGTSDFVDEAKLETELAASLARLRLVQETHGRQGKVIALLGGSGGSGASTLAVNLAVGLAQKGHHPLLLDLGLPLGDLATLLDLKPAHSLAELCPKAGRMDRSMIEQTLAYHDSGVKLLAAPLELDDRARISSEGANEVVRLARRMFSHVIIDVDHALDPEQVAAITQADLVLIVLQLQVVCLRRTCRALDYLERLGVPRERIRVVVNRHGNAREIPVARAEKALGLPISHYIPDDPRSINEASNDGVPVVLESSRSRVSRSLVDLATTLNGKGA